MDVLSRAGDFLASQGRDVERALFEHHFGSLSLDGFLDVLARYQSADGGFGRRLEVDIESDASNPFATEVALALFRECAVPGDHQIVRRTVEYLERTQDEAGDWRFSPERSPHWVVYQSNKSGQNEVYIDSFPRPRGEKMISTGGGTTCGCCR